MWGTLHKAAVYGSDDHPEPAYQPSPRPFLKSGHPPGEHGGGQRQRISIARSLLRKPDIILWDEATSALDNISERKVQQAFEKLSKGKTTFIVAHRLSTIRNVKKIVVMKDGQCVEEGDYEMLMEKKGVFWEMQNMNLGNLLENK